MDERYRCSVLAASLKKRAVNTLALSVPHCSGRRASKSTSDSTFLLSWSIARESPGLPQKLGSSSRNGRPGSRHGIDIANDPILIQTLPLAPISSPSTSFSAFPTALTSLAKITLRTLFSQHYRTCVALDSRCMPVGQTRHRGADSSSVQSLIFGNTLADAEQGRRSSEA